MVPLDSLTAASGDLQPRERADRAASELQIGNIAANLDPARLMRAPEADRGAPIVGPDNVVESGNGRVAAIQRAAEQHPERYAAYVDALRREGYPVPDDGKAYALVARRTSDLTPEDRVKFVQEANQAATQRMSAGEQARVDAANLSGHLLGGLDHTVDVLHGNNHGFVRQWVATLPEAERNAVLTADGSLSAEGLRRLHGALLARAYDDKGVLARNLEHTDDSVRSVSGALVDAAPAWAKLRGAITAGEVPPEFGTHQQLTEAVDRVRQAREKRQKMSDVLGQQDAFNPMAPETERYVRSLYNPEGTAAASRPAMADVLRRYADEAMRQRADQSGLFEGLDGNQKVTPAAALDAILKRRDEEAAARKAGVAGQGQGTLLGTGTGLRPEATPKGEPAGETPAASTGKPPPVSGETGPAPPRALTPDESRAGAAAGREAYQNQGKGVGGLGETSQKRNFARGWDAGLRGEAPPAKTTALWRDAYEGGKAWRAENIDRDRAPMGEAADDRPLAAAVQPDAAGMSAHDAAIYAEHTETKTPREFMADLDTHGGQGAAVITEDGLLRHLNPLDRTSTDAEGNIHGGDTDHAALFTRLDKATTRNEVEVTTYGSNSVAVSSARPVNAAQMRTIRQLKAEYKRTNGFEDGFSTYLPRAADDRPLEAAAAPAVAGGTRPPLGGTVPKREFNEGTSPYRQVFHDAGHDPDLAVNYPIERQVKIISDQVRDKFGFKDVKLDERQPPKELRDQMSNFYQNAMEMANILGMPHEAIGLNKRLTFSTKPYFQKNQALGWYRPSAREINIPGRSNSFAHEWTHALDHYLADALGKNPKAMKLLSQKAGMWDDPSMLNGRRVTPGSSAEAFVNVLRAMYGKDAGTAAEALKLQMELRSGDPRKAAAALARMPALETEFAKNSRGVPQTGLSYWSTPHEMIARAHEAYVSEKLRQQGRDTRAIAKPDYEPHGANDSFASIYPQEGERAQIFQRFTDLHDALRSETLLGQGTGARPSGLGIVDPSVWHRMLPSNTPKGFVEKLRAEVQAQRNWWTKTKRGAGYDPAAADPGRLTVQTRTGDALAHLGYTARGMMERIAARQPPAAKRAYTAIMDQLTPAEHTRKSTAGRTIAPVFEEDVRANSRRNTNQLVNILANNGLDWDPLRNPLRSAAIEREKDMLHHALTTGEDVLPGRDGAPDRPIPDNIKKAAGSIRYLMDQEWERNTKAGVNIGYTRSGYFPRMYDDTKIFGDERGFKKDAGKLHGRMFEDTVGDDPQKLHDAYMRIPKDVRDGMHPDTQDGMGELKRALRERDKLQEGLDKSKDPDADQARIDKLDQDIADLHDAHHDDVRDTYAKTAAEEWFNRVNNGDATDYDTRGPSSQYTQKRELPGYADEIMRPWLDTDTSSALPRYFQQSGRRVAFAERFGPKGEKLDDWIDQATKGGARGEDNRAMRNLVETITGRAKTGRAGGLEQASNFVHAMGTLALMPRAMWSSVSEPIGAALKTGRMRDAYSALAHQVGDIAKTADSKQRGELANALGVTTSHLLDSILSDRANAHYRDSPNMGRVVGNFFRRSGLTGLTNAQRRSMLGTGHKAMTAWAKDFQGTNARKARDAAAEFTDLGVDPSKHKVFADWLTSHDGLPSLADLETPGGRLWGRAVTRFVDHVIQDPMRVDKPIMSQNPVGRLAYGLTAFNYSFYHNLVERPLTRAGARVGESYRDARQAGAGPVGAGVRAGVSAGREGSKIAAAAGAVYAGSLMTTAVREALFNSDAWQQHEEEGNLQEWLMDLALARTGVNGPFDPVAQALTGLKYERDLSGLVAGPHLGYMLSAAQDIIKGFAGDGSADTNTAYHNAAKGAYNLLAVPAISYALSSIPGGPIASTAAGAAMQYLTSRQASKHFATAVAGPKGAKEGGEVPEKPEPKDDDEAVQKPEGSGLLNVPPGLLDDAIAPLLRVAAPVWAVTPKPIKYAAAGLAALLAGRSVNNELERFRP